MILKNIQGFYGIYKIDIQGHVYSIARATPIILKAFVGTTGYWMVNLHKENKQYMRRVHRLMAIAFIPNPENKRCINHKNGIKTDNCIENLEWCTYSENTKHSYDVLKRCLPDGPRNAKSKLIIDLQTGIFYDSIKFAAIAKGIERNVLKSRLRYYGEYKSLRYA